MKWDVDHATTTRRCDERFLRRSNPGFDLSLMKIKNWIATTTTRPRNDGFTILKAFIVITAVLTLSACGQSGKLYLPAEKSQPL